MKNPAIFVFLAVAVITGYLLYKNPQVYQKVTSTPSPTQNPLKAPVVKDPLPNSTVSSPVIIKGTVPPGWMFEGSFPIRVTDSNKNTIGTGNGGSVIPGAWMEESPIEFTANVVFTKTTESGYIILEKDNPSGNPENSGSFEIPVKFN